MIVAGDFRKGVTFEWENSVWTIVDFQHVKPGKGAAFVRTKMNAHLGEEDEKRFLLDQGLERLTTCEDVAEAVEELLNGDETGLVVRIESRLK